MATKNINAEKIQGNLNITSISASTISGTTYYGDGSNLTGISSEDNFVTGGTFTTNTLTLNRQNGSVTITGFTSDTNTTVTGFTYDNANTFTIGNSDGSNYSASINSVTGLTVNGSISATTISATKFYGDGSNLTGISSEDNFVTGGTFSANTLTLNRQNGLVSITGFTSTPILSNGEIYVGDTSNNAQSVAMTGDINISITGTTTIQPDVVTYDKIQDVTQRAILGSEDFSGGTVTEIPVVDQFLSTGTATSLLTGNNWDINGNYTGSTISGTFQSQMYYDGNYFFIAVLDNTWVRLIRG